MKTILQLMGLLLIFASPTTFAQTQTLKKVPGLDSPFRETNLSITPNGKYLFFMSQRGGMPWSSRGTMALGSRTPQYDGDIWYAVKQGDSWSAPKCLGPNINTYSGEDEPNITADGQGVYFQSWRDGWEWSGGPYYRAELNGTEWGKPVGMGSNITQFFKDLDLRSDKVFEKDLKQKGLYRDYVKYRTIYPFSWVPKLEKKGINFNDYILGTDGMAISPNEQMFIVSAYNPDKKRYDLFISYRKNRNEWTYPEPLEIPNQSNEISVYIAGDNQTIYFASDRRGGLGGFDIYKTTLKSGTSCTPPINIGAPHNTPRDDYSFVVDPVDEKAYQVVDGAIHSVELTDLAKPEEILVINGKVIDQFGAPWEARIRLVDSSNPSKTIARARSNKNSGEFSFSFSKKEGKFKQIATTTSLITGEKSFSVNANTGKQIEQIIVIERPVAPEEDATQDEDPVVENDDTGVSNDPVAEDEATVVDELKNTKLKEGATLTVDKLFFKADSDEIQSESYKVLDELAAAINQRSDIKKIEIGGHTNGLPPTDYCERLSTARAKQIFNYLTSKKVNRSRLVYKGYGKRLPIATNETPEGRRKNQRVEIKILEIE